MENLVSALDWVGKEVRGILARVLDDHELSPDHGIRLSEAEGRELQAVVLVADEMRRRQAGPVVTYVVNRNINFTNVCIKRCGFCAFSRDHREEEGYLLPLSEIIRRAKEAWEMGATEVCVQAGLPPQMEGDLYIRLCEAIKAELPDIHIHGFSPEEVLYGSVRSRCSIRDYLLGLRDAGVGSLPGTSAEILDQEMRDRISPGRITVQQWVEVITTAHRCGIRSTSTLMYGHIETPAHWVAQLRLLRRIQAESGGFTEFVPLGFVHQNTLLFHQGIARPGPTLEEHLKIHALARVLLAGAIHNIQVSWVKLGRWLSQLCLQAGANDYGGTLMEENISRLAGATAGQCLTPEEFHQRILELGRIPAERNTTYSRIRKYPEIGHSSAVPAAAEAGA